MRAGRARPRAGGAKRRRRRGPPGAWLLLAGGAAAAWYVAWGEGARARRGRIGDRARALSHQARRHGGRMARHLGSEAFGAAQRLVHRQPAPPPDDLTLLDRVESELFAEPGIPKGKLNLEVDRGVLVVRGELGSQAEIERVRSAAARIAGVKAVHSYLHLPHTPAPNKAEALRVSTVAEWREGS